MPGRVYASILQRASSCSRTPSLSSHFQHAYLPAIHSSQLRPAHRGQLSSWATFRSARVCTNGEKHWNRPQCERHLSTHQDLDFYLNQIQINLILQSNEQTVIVPESDGRGLSAVRKFDSNQVTANTPIEDRRSAATCLQSKGMLFGVFDGHGGWACAQAVSERLLYYTAVAMMPKRSLEELEKCMEHDRPVPPILQWFKHYTDFYSLESDSLYNDHLRVFWQELQSKGHGEGMSPHDALELAFKRLDADLSMEAQVPLSNDLMKSKAIQVALAGSTACVAHVGTEGIHVANAGDCRAVLGVQGVDGSWSALPLSQDHNSQNKAELERIKAQHPPSESDTVITDDRLLGVLMPLRAFGDVQFKWSLEMQQNILANLECGLNLDSLNLYHCTPPNYLSPPYLDVAPEITYHKLRPQDRFLILGTDGLWDELENEQAVQLIGEHLNGIHLQAPFSPCERQLKLGRMHELLLNRQTRASPAGPNGATHLIRHALGTGDYGVFCQERLVSMLALPEDLARMYRDDITVTVVYLNSD